VAIEDAAPARSPALGPDECAWLFAQACLLAGRRRLICHLTAPPPSGVPGFESGRVVAQSLRHGDEELFEAMRSSARRMARRARDAGYAVVEGGDDAQRRAFATLQRLTRLRHGQWAVPEPPESPEPGEAWREWELPWMWLLLAVRGAAVEAGIGDAVRPGAMLEGRTGASSARARHDGAFAWLCWEEMRRGRDLGHLWLNHGTDTRFKREVAGALALPISIYGWMGGGNRAERLVNHSEAWAQRTRPRMSALMRRVARPTKGSPA
jgi:hypothetical protein